MIPKIHVPATMEFMWVGSFQHNVITALNNIIDHLNQDEEKANLESGLNADGSLMNE